MTMTFELIEKSYFHLTSDDSSALFTLSFSLCTRAMQTPLPVT